MPEVRHLVLVAVAAALLVPATASAKLTPTVAIEQQGAKSRLVVSFAGTAKPSERPRAVSVRSGKKRWGLRKLHTFRWATKLEAGKKGAALAALVTKRVSVAIRTATGTRTRRLVVKAPIAAPPPAPATSPAAPVAPAPAPAAPQGRFERPPGELTGPEAANHVQRYFANSVFTDCPAGWPNCSVEERYTHCESGAWEYKRLTPTSGSDITSTGTYAVKGVNAHTDGSWDVDYEVTAYGATSFYSWRVAANGTVTGAYRSPSGEVSQLGPLQWMQTQPC